MGIVAVCSRIHLTRFTVCHLDSLVVDAEVADRQVPVQLHEKREIIAEHIDEEKMQDSRQVPMWIAAVVVLVVLILIYIVKRWTKL